MLPIILFFVYLLCPTNIDAAVPTCMYVIVLKTTFKSKSVHTVYYSLLLLLIRLHGQSSSSDEDGGLLQVLQAPI